MQENKEFFMAKRKKTRRSSQKYPALDPAYNLKRRSELIDQDYISKLSEKEKEWLNKFNEEWVNDTLDRKNPKNNLHRTKKLRKDCDDRNNSRNRDVLTMYRTTGDITTLDVVNFNPENDLIDRISQEVLEKRLKKTEHFKRKKKSRKSS